MNCLICGGPGADRAELELHYASNTVEGDEASVIVEVGLCRDCWEQLRSHADNVDQVADRREAFEEAFFTCAVRYWEYGR